MNTDNTQPESVPAWMALDTMADAVCDKRWGNYRGPLVEGASEQEWCSAWDGDFAATRDDMAVALYAMEQQGWLSVDWDAEPPSPRVLRDGSVAGSGVDT